MEALFAFIKRYNYVFVFLLLEIFSIVFITQNSNYQGSKIVQAGNAVAGRCYGTMSLIRDYFGLRKENERLAAENAELRARLESSYISYNLREFVHEDTVYKQRYSYTEARVVKNSWNQTNNYIMINKGRLQGVHLDQAVISPQGIVGVVVNTTDNFATVMPVLHSNSRNSVRINRINTNGSLLWRGGDFRFATLVDIPTTHTLKTNDTPSRCVWRQSSTSWTMCILLTTGSKPSKTRSWPEPKKTTCKNDKTGSLEYIPLCGADSAADSAA